VNYNFYGKAKAAAGTLPQNQNFNPRPCPGGGPTCSSAITIPGIQKPPNSSGKLVWRDCRLRMLWPESVRQRRKRSISKASKNKAGHKTKNSETKKGNSTFGGNPPNLHPSSCAVAPSNPTKAFPIKCRFPLIPIFIKNEPQNGTPFWGTCFSYSDPIPLYFVHVYEKKVGEADTGTFCIFDDIGSCPNVRRKTSCKKSG